MGKAQYKYVWNRRSRLDKHGRGLIELRIYLDGKTYYLSSGVKVESKQWKEKKGETRIVKHKNQISLNAFLDDQRNKLEKYELKLRERGEAVTFGKLKNFWNGEKVEVNFLEFVRDYVEKDTRKASKKHNKSLLKKLDDFGGIVDFADLTHENIEQFDKYLRNRPTIKEQSTIYVAHKRLKAMVNRAIAHRHLKPQDNPYITFKPKSGNTDTIRYLTREQLNKIEATEMKLPRLQRVKDVFLFSCYTGIGPGDLEQLTKDNIKEYDGDLWIVARRKKTRFYFEVPLLPKSLEILRKYWDVLPNRIVPKISDQKTNAYLKEIAGLAGVDVHLTFYMARHTFATTVTLENNISIEAVSKMLGHSELKTTQVYAKVRRERIAKEMNELKNRE